jgi:ribosomal protein L29
MNTLKKDVARIETVLRGRNKGLKRFPWKLNAK